MQKPTVGRKVWFWGGPSFGTINDANQPFDATVIFVWSDTCVNLHVVDHAGVTRALTSCFLRDHQEGDAHGVGYVATWMPYQMKQHEKATEPALAPEIPHHHSV